MSRRVPEYKIEKGGPKKIPLKWSAPETTMGYVYNRKTDVYSFGVAMWEVFTDGEEPYGDLNGYEVKKKVTS